MDEDAKKLIIQLLSTEHGEQAGKPLNAEQALKALGVSDARRESCDISPSELLSRLKEASRVFFEQQDFEVGDIVMWKDRMKNRKRPRYNEPAMVVELLDRPVFDAAEGPGSPYFQEPLDIRLGFVDDEGDFVVYVFDRRRFAIKEKRSTRI